MFTPNTATSGPQNEWWGTSACHGGSPGGATHVKTFECPSDYNLYNYQTGMFACFTTQPAWTGTTTGYTFTGVYFAGSNGSLALGATNYLPCGGALGNDAEFGDTAYGQYVGPYYHASMTTIPTVTNADGMAYTMAFGEALGGSSGQPRDFAACWMGSTPMVTAWGLTNPTPSSPSGWFQFGSRHTGMVNFAFCDGHVSGVRYSASTTTIYQASGFEDGQPYDISQLTN